VGSEIDRLAQSIDNMGKSFEAGLGRVHDRLDQIDKRQQNSDIVAARHMADNGVHHEAPCAELTKHFADLDRTWGRAPAWFTLAWLVGSAIMVGALKLFGVLS